MNVVLITVDSLRFDRVGFSSQSADSLTPNVDELAGDAHVFSTAFSNAPYTRASFPSILTGTFPWEYGGVKKISDERPALADVLARNGYETAGFHSNPYLRDEVGYGRGFDRFVDGHDTESKLSRLRQYVANNISDESLLYQLLRSVYSTVEQSSGIELGTPYEPAERINQSIDSWLDTLSNPGFLWVHYMDPHHPYVPHDGTVSEAVDRREAIKLRQKMIEAPDSLSESETETLVDLYHGEIEYVDRCIGNLLERIDETMGLSDTAVIFMADHGEAFGEHGYFGHPDELHDVLTRIPLFVRIPSADGRVVETPVSAIDVVPTLLDVANCEIPNKCKGVSLRSTAANPPSERVVFAQVGERADGKVMACSERYKLVRDFGTESETWYRRSDVPSSEVDPEDVESDQRETIESGLEEHLSSVEETGMSEQQITVSRDVEDRLEKLGYK